MSIFLISKNVRRFKKPHFDDTNSHEVASFQGVPRLSNGHIANDLTLRAGLHQY